MDYFDEDELLEDYINDEDDMFDSGGGGGNVGGANDHGFRHGQANSGSGGGGDGGDDDIEARMIEEAEAMLMEQQQEEEEENAKKMSEGTTSNNEDETHRQQQFNQGGAGTTTGATTTTGTTTNKNSSSSNSSSSNNNSDDLRDVNEYLESRRSMNDGYSLDRFNLDVDNWREAPKQHQEAGKKKLKNSKNDKSNIGKNGSISDSFRLRGGPVLSSTFSKQQQKKHHHTTPVAQFLDLLQIRASRETTSSELFGTKVKNNNNPHEDADDGYDDDGIIPRHRKIEVVARSSNGVMRTPKQGIRSVPMTLGDGTCVHIFESSSSLSSFKDDDDKNNDRTRPTATSSSYSTSTLGVSMKELKRRVESIQRHKIAQRNKRDTTSRHHHRHHHRTDKGSSSSSGSNKKKEYGDQLWVDRHAPVSFGHLLSDERTNRAVLRSLREWDPYVFGREPPAASSSSSWNQNNKQNQQQQQEGSSGSKTNPNDKRPEESRRVILLSGPPGVGKSTLAHIVARHAGYQAVEVNASDDRSSNVLVDRVVRAMESTTINFSSTCKMSSAASSVGKENNSNANHSAHHREGNASSIKKSQNDHVGRPNCIILDEIDGADAKGAIQALVDMIRADIPSKNSKQKVPYLRRPIICICNHKHAPVLRPLHKYAVHFNVDAPSSARLVVRLKDILNREGLNMAAGGSLLQKLNDSTGGDIRSCINTLQFASSEARTSNDLSLALTDVLNGSGLKDSRCDLPSTLMTVFQKAKGKTAFPGRNANSGTNKGRSDKNNTTSVIESIEGFGDDTTATSAIFMNIMGVSYIDPAFDRCSAAHELLSAVDSSRGSLEDNQRSYNHLAPVAAGIHLLCRVEVKPRLNYSTRELADSHFQREANLQLVRQFADALPAKARHFKCRSLLSEEFIPLVLWVLSAGHGAASLSRAVSSIDILTSMERERLDAHVKILSSLGLTYVQDNSRELSSANGKPSYLGGDESLFEMRLDPPIHHLIQYRTRPLGQMRRREIPTGMKELIAHQVRLDSLRRQDEISSGQSPRADSTDAQDPAMEGKMRLESPGKTPTFSQTNSPTSKALNIQQTKKSFVTPAKEEKSIDAAKPTIKTTPSPTAGNFLGIGARKAKEMKSARRAAAVGLEAGGGRLSKKVKLAHTGSGFALNQVVKMRYVKGFTQAVRTKCRLEDLE